MPFDIRKQASDEREALNDSIDISHITRQIEALRLHASSCYTTLPQSEGGLKARPHCRAIKAHGTSAKFRVGIPDRHMLALPWKTEATPMISILHVRFIATERPPVRADPGDLLLQGGALQDRHRCRSIIDSRSICYTQVPRVFIVWLLLSSDAPRTPILKFRFNSWGQMVSLQAVVAECFGFDGIRGHPHNAKLRRKRRNIVVRYLKRSDPTQYYKPIPIVTRPEPKKGESLSEQQKAVMIGLSLRRPGIHIFPHIYLAQARRLLLLNCELRFPQRKRITSCISGDDCSLLPERPRWMEALSEPVWPGKCMVRAGAQPPEYQGRLWSKKELLTRKKKASKARSLPMNILKSKLRRRLARLSSKIQVEKKQTLDQRPSPTIYNEEQAAPDY